ncbi:MAG: AraC family transcriptional regulator [Ardenticatenaceae bacterium]|nr:AraC family transcriptional regulator [Ardenticatenaceae bacterium]
MTYQTEKLEAFIKQLDKHGPEEGFNTTYLDAVAVIRESESHAKVRAVYEPFLVIVGKGEKICYVGERAYEYGPGSGLVVLLPMPVQTEIIGATPDNPFLAAVIALNHDRMSDILLRMERADGYHSQPTVGESSGIFSIPLTDELIRPILRLFEALESPRDTAILSELIIDEIHYRLLCHERGEMLRVLLQQRGQISRITRAVDHIHHNLDKPVSVEQLAEMVHMSRTTFHEHFRAVMHVSPLQYAKSMKLFQAQQFIREGKNASEAGYLVGYNSPAQFSREYKRHFGYAPSATAAAG